MHGRVDIIVTVLYQGVSPVMRSRGVCGFWCVGGPQKFRAVARPKHPPTDIPRNATVKCLPPSGRTFNHIAVAA